MLKSISSSLFLLAIFLLLKPNAIQANNNDPNQSQTNSSDHSLISQLAAQNMADSISTFNHFDQILNGLDNTINTSETYQSLRHFWYKDVFGIFFGEIQQSISQFFHDIRYLYLPSAVISLGHAIKQFFLNTDLTKIQNASKNTNDLSFMLKQFNDTMFGIAMDISLLLFILSIWRYWVDSAWKGSSNLMSPVARLIFSIGLLIAWPTIYSFQIQLSNELMSALFIDNNGNIQFLDLAMTRLFDPNNLSIGTIFNASNVLAISIFSTNFSFFIESLLPVILCLLAIILIYQLTYILILKAIQTALMTAQYVFAPIFLVLLTNPVTDNVATGFIRTFVEVSLWNFIWLGLLKILVILLYSNFNPWGKILTTIGILQIMMDVPQFLSHAKISVASDFVNTRSLVKAVKDLANYDDKLKGGVKMLQSLFTSDEKNQNTTASSMPDASLKENDFSFARSNNESPNLLPPLRKDNPQSNGNQQAYWSGQPQPESSAAGLSGTYAAGAAAGSATSAGIMMGNSAIAMSSSSSSANALAIAITSPGNSPGATAYPPNGTKPPNPDSRPKSPNSPSPPEPNPKPPSGPNSVPPDGNTREPSTGPSNPSPYCGGSAFNTSRLEPNFASFLGLNPESNCTQNRRTKNFKLSHRKPYTA